MTSQLSDDPLFVRARLGTEAEAFLQTNLGQHILRKAEEDIESAYKALSLVDPFDTNAVIELQNRIKVARAIPQWLAETVNEGHLAASVIEEEEAYEGE